MEVGLLWFDSDPKRTLADKVERAAFRYREKFGRLPNRCFVHPTVITDSATTSPLACRLTDPASTIWVVSAPNILLHHYWLGVGTKERPKRGEE